MYIMQSTLGAGKTVNVLMPSQTLALLQKIRLTKMSESSLLNCNRLRSGREGEEILNDPPPPYTVMAF
jgi:hypothetical protein